MTSETVLGLIERFKDNRERFIAFCRSLSDEELERAVPSSSYRVKDFVSHLATLDPVMAGQFERAAQGRMQELGRGDDGAVFDVDTYNDGEVAARRDWTLDQMLEEAAANRVTFLSSLAKLEDEHIDRVIHFTGDNKRDPADLPFKIFLQGLARHDQIHVADMVKALPDRAEDPEIRAWLDDTVVKWYQTAMAGPPRR
ncbi:MAG TPA: maleylpyruvate isomerase N-terminal domain-containing protein [Dehalococcoidia bacterium]|nr:maleylpyruvate isomerase N-terminal domain-containing protein [Dehalococcoidia bacterium]